ncbi:MAG: hypothetical protein SWY16_11110 [Cyanobacteriota bacterium]|nr:hypothetical protein [Cyanobacteriota bacterium]
MAAKKTQLFNGIGLVAAGFLTLHLFAGVKTLKCDRPNLDRPVTCQLTNAGIFGDRLTPIKELQGARLQRRKGNYRVVLQTDRGSVNFTNLHWFAKGKQEKRVAEIEDFLNSPEQKNLTIEQNSNWFAVPIAILFSIGGIWEIIDILNHRE